MLFESDPIIRQIKQLADFAAAMAGASGSVNGDDLEAQIQEAYLGLLGIDADFADSLGPEALLRMMHDDHQREALVRLLLAHGDLQASRGDDAGARRRWLRAEAMLDALEDATALRDEVSARVG